MWRPARPGVCRDLQGRNRRRSLSMPFAQLSIFVTIVTRVQHAALPLRRRAGAGTEAMLVTSRRTKRWIIPKGWPMGRKAPPPPRRARRSMRSKKRELLGELAPARSAPIHTRSASSMAGSLHARFLYFPQKGSGSKGSGQKKANARSDGFHPSTLPPRCRRMSYGSGASVLI